MISFPNSARIAAVLGSLVICVSSIAEVPQGQGTSSQATLYVGTYTKAKSKGIYLLHMDLATGKLTEPELAAETTNPSYLAIAPGRKFLYAAAEIDNFNGKHSGAISAFAIDPASGKLTLLNAQPSGGSGPCFVTIDKAGRNALVANYNTGSVAVLPIGDDGKVGEPSSVIQHHGSGPDKSRQAGPHAHSINLDAANRFALACDLGLDKVFVYQFDGAKGTLTANDPQSAAAPPGAGPRHLVFHPNGRFVYVSDEMAHAVTSFSYDADKGVLTSMETVPTLPADFHGSDTSADLHMHPSGKFLYASDRGANTIAVFSVDAETGKLTPASHQSTGGKTPRNFAIDPTGAFLIAANQDSNSLVVFRIDAQTGALTPTGDSAEVGAPVCVKFVEMP